MHIPQFLYEQSPCVMTRLFFYTLKNKHENYNNISDYKNKVKILSILHYTLIATIKDLVRDSDFVLNSLFIASSNFVTI